jgi:hypothetical protein
MSAPMTQQEAVDRHDPLAYFGMAGLEYYPAAYGREIDGLDHHAEILITNAAGDSHPDDDPAQPVMVTLYVDHRPFNHATVTGWCLAVAWANERIGAWS